MVPEMWSKGLENLVELGPVGSLEDVLDLEGLLGLLPEVLTPPADL